jgi:NAD(P)H-binding
MRSPPWSATRPSADPGRGPHGPDRRRLRPGRQLPDEGGGQAPDPHPESGQFDDYARTDAAVSGSGLDWTIVRPGWLNNGAHRAYRTSLDHGTPGANSISRHDLADFLLPADDSTIGHAVFIGY